MIVVDKNQTLQPPEGRLDSVSAEGGYILLSYVQPFWDNPLRRGNRVTTIYLQSMGREVLRTIDDNFDPQQPEVSTPPLVARRYKIWNGILLILQDIQEMFQ